ncbi:holo-ACP synthase [Malonomonas rubra DSM 5091]|uniref:citrate lyase holo-[acyl-carrier protein] synthase n=1 Tax=Malonomonas rubra DSM 5091 TaxID=1122189 RepID=A0A1M6G6V4_MALRU|nr:citrate lyase holo-[acyl-carrier protein] synthase [Malonomonas rubra]SHJ05659.1 holo-ACP synthase [Malonomonas rubra DSM 5091]
MPYEKLRLELLQARQQREERRLQTCQHIDRTLIQLSLNIPGPDKVPPGAERLFGWGLRQVLELLPLVESCSHGHDKLGPWALLGTGQNASQMKRQAVALEKATAAGRLLDIDVYDHRGRQLGRRELGLPARSCLICDCPAVDCMREQRHSEKQLKVKIDELLSTFRS